MSSRGEKAELKPIRSSTASILIEQGYELQVISAVLGHSSIHTTFEYYADIMDAKCEIKAFYDDIYAVDGGD